MTRIKICGVTLADDAALVASAGVEFIGLNFWPKSKRYLDPSRAPTIAGVVRAIGATKLVGVFVDPSVDELREVTESVQLDVIQLHGDESVDDCVRITNALSRPVWKAIPVASPGDIEHLEAWPVEAIVLDAPVAGRGGAGARFDHAIARDARERYSINLVLAGGLDPTNVAAAIATVQPWCVDVASGVEAAPGVKDRAKLTAFVAAVRGVAPPA